MNGTLTNRGDLIEDVVPLVRGLLRTCPCNFLCADTFGTLARVGAEAQVVRSGEDKRKVVEDPKGRPLDEVREIRDDIARRVAELDTGSRRDAV